MDMFNCNRLIDSIFLQKKDLEIFGLTITEFPSEPFAILSLLAYSSSLKNPLTFFSFNKLLSSQPWHLLSGRGMAY